MEILYGKTLKRALYESNNTFYCYVGSLKKVNYRLLRETFTNKNKYTISICDVFFFFSITSRCFQSSYLL